MRRGDESIRFVPFLMNEEGNQLTEVVKVMTKEDYENALVKGHIEEKSLQTEGFIHCCTPEQVEEVKAKHFSGKMTVVLTLDQERLGDTLVFERAKNGAMYPHVYQAIPLGAVIAIQDQ